MKKNDLKRILISFERANDSQLVGYDFLKNPPENQGGGLLDQVVMVKEEISIDELIDTFIEINDYLSELLAEEYSYLIACILSLSLNATSVKLFPDEYQEILELVKETKNDYSLNQEKLKELINKDLETIKILDALITEGFLRQKKNGDYVVKKRLLTNINISFLQIADKGD